MAEQDKDRIPTDDYERELTTDLDDDTPDKPKGMALHTKIFIGLAVGVLGGLAANWTLGGKNEWVIWTVENFTRPIGQLFLSLRLPSRIRSATLGKFIGSNVDGGNLENPRTIIGAASFVSLEPSAKA